MMAAEFVLSKRLVLRITAWLDFPRYAIFVSYLSYSKFCPFSRSVSAIPLHLSFFRNCIGQNFAMNEMKVALSQILRNFKLYLDEETPEPKMNFRMTLQSEDGVFIKLSPLDA